MKNAFKIRIWCFGFLPGSGRGAGRWCPLSNEGRMIQKCASSELKPDHRAKGVSTPVRQ